MQKARPLARTKGHINNGPNNDGNDDDDDDVDDDDPDVFFLFFVGTHGITKCCINKPKTFIARRG